MAHDPVLSITDKALAKILEIRSQEPDGDQLALEIRIVGVRDEKFSYDLAMIGAQDIAPADHIEAYGVLSVVIPADSVENIRGATLDVSRDLLNPGLEIDNPNGPSPRISSDGPHPELTGPVAEQIVQVLDQQINPAIAAHGGVAELVAIEAGIAYLRLGGGCQGCGIGDTQPGHRTDPQRSDPRNHRGDRCHRSRLGPEPLLRNRQKVVQPTSPCSDRWGGTSGVLTVSGQEPAGFVGVGAGLSTERRGQIVGNSNLCSA